MWLTWLVEGRVAASGMPHPEDVPALWRAGVRAILSLTERTPFPDGPPPDLRHAHVPVPDMTTPSDETLREAVGFLREQVAAGTPVLVHCGAGLGRTGTVVACWLVSEGMDPEEAIHYVRRMRPGSIETPGQEDAVRRFRWEERG